MKEKESDKKMAGYKTKRVGIKKIETRAWLKRTMIQNVEEAMEKKKIDDLKASRVNVCYHFARIFILLTDNSGYPSYGCIFW